MKWGLQHVKVTLEEQDSGETVVIEQSSDGRVKCEPGKSGKAERAANSTPRTREAKIEEPAAKPDKPRAERRRENKKPDGRPAGGTKSRAQKSKAGDKPAASRRSTSLEWVPVRDYKYNGFAADSGGGQFKALIAEGSIWALFYEVREIVLKQLGCFSKLNDAKKEAQRYHDEGWPEAEFGTVTAGRIAKFCPAPRAGDKDEEKKEAMKKTPKTEEKKTQEKPPPAPAPAASKTETEQDRELLASFTSELERGLDEDEDD